MNMLKEAMIAAALVVTVTGDVQSEEYHVTDVYVGIAEKHLADESTSEDCRVSAEKALDEIKLLRLRNPSNLEMDDALYSWHRRSEASSYYIWQKIMMDECEGK